MKLQHAGKSLTGAVVIFELCRLALVLKLFVVPSDVYKCTTKQFNNPNPIYSRTPLNVTISNATNQ